GKPFILFIVVNFVIIAVAEALHYMPGLGWTNALDFSFLEKQVISLMGAIFVYIATTIISCRKSCLRFQKIYL
ncbi:MAG: ABC-2 transporter permease, partial [Firmicutes bacterium]|nr:ABC-2 transporter permease [Bacillota bacterium]